MLLHFKPSQCLLVFQPFLASSSPSSSLLACKSTKNIIYSVQAYSRANTHPSIAGWAGATLDPSWFIKEQTSTPSLTVDDNSRLVALQLGNCYGLLFLAAVAVLYTTTELKVVRNYLIALWIADIGHIAVCYLGLGYERFVDVASWNSMTWGNVGATVSGVFFGTSEFWLADQFRGFSLLDEGGVSLRFLWSGCCRSKCEEDPVRVLTLPRL